MSEEQSQSTSLTQPVKSRANLKQLLELNKESIAAVIPSYLTPEKILKVVMLTAMSNPDLFECTKESILKAVMISAQTGIPIGPRSGHLVPFNKKVKARGNVPEHWVKEAQFIPDYRGLIGQAKRCGAITKAEAHLVYIDDAFEIDWGNEDKPLTHKPNFFSAKREQKDIVAAYFRAKLPDGDYQYEVMTKNELDAIRKRSKSAENGPWVTDTEQMYRKTVSKRGLNYIPNLDDNTVAAIEHDNAIDRGESIDVVGLLTDIASDVAPTTDVKTVTTSTTSAEETKSKLETVANKVAGEKAKQEDKKKADVKVEQRKVEPSTIKKTEPAKVVPTEPAGKTDSEVPPWAQEQATETAGAAETQSTDTGDDADSGLSTESVDGEAVERVKSKSNPIHGVAFPEFIDIVNYEDTPSEDQKAKLHTVFQELCDLMGQQKNLGQTIKNFTGLEEDKVNAATVDSLIQVFGVLKTKHAKK